MSDDNVPSTSVQKKFSCSLCGFKFSKEKFLTNHYDFCKDIENPSDRLGANKNAVNDVPPAKELSNTELLDEHSTTDLTYDIKFEEIEFTENTVFGLASTESRQPIEGLKTEVLDQEFKCGKCNYATVDATQLEEHKKIHLEHTPYKCKICGTYTTTNLKYLKVHERRHAVDKPFKCTVCKFSAVKQCALAEHMTVHTGKRFECGKCNYAFSRLRTFQNHMRTHNGDKPELKNTEILDGNSTTDITYVEKVEDRELTENTIFGSACTESPQTIDSLNVEAPEEKCNGLTAEATQFPEPEKVLIEPQLYKCNICTMYTTTKLRYLKQHVQRHAANKSFKCTVCEYSAVTRCALAEHMSVHTGVRQFKCSICDYASSRRNTLKTHMRTHYRDKPEFENSKLLDGQSTTDMTCVEKVEEREFTENTIFGSDCTESPQPIDSLNVEASEEQCNDVTAEGTQLQEHEKEPIEPKAYKCNICTTYTTTTRKYLKDHEKRHAADKPYKCTICKYSSVKKCTLAEHMSVHTGVKRFKCSICDYASAKRFTVKKHMRTHYGDKPELKNTELLDGQSTTDMTYVEKDEEREFPDNSIFGSTCPTSPQPIDSWNTKQEHEKVPIEPKIYKCNICAIYTTTNLKYLKKHERIHAVDKPFKCAICKYSAVSKTTLGQHMKWHIGEKRYQCDVCGIAFVTLSSLTCHMTTHTGEKRFLCAVCGFATACHAVLNRHIRRHTGEKAFKCSECDYASSWRTNFANHMKIHNGELRQTSLVKEHAEEELPSSSTGEKSFKCSFCDYASRQRHELTVHVQRKHAEGKTFLCDQCDKAFARRPYLLAHIRRTHTMGTRAERLFACKICEFSTKVLLKFRIHMANHTFKCAVCHLVVTHRSALIIHMRSHTGEKPIKCGLCEYSTTTSSMLKSHMKQHTQEKYFKCDVCDKTFLHSCNRTEHMRSHTGEKPYQCKVCEYKCARHYALTKHMRTHTGDKPYRCSVCDYASTSSCNLKVHMKTHR